MPTPDPTNVLFRIAHPNLYERNPFNVLNLSVNATAKDIRRRREDIEAAFDAGTEAEVFADILPADAGRKPPTREEAADLFAALEDPATRIAYALFWFWPEESAGSGASMVRTRNANPNGAFRHEDDIRRWETVLLRRPKSESIVQRHNLAVFHHMMGLAYDEIYTEQVAYGPTPPKEVDGHWREAIRWWNDIVSDSDLWRSVSEFVSALGDPRLDYRFTRSLRDQFAYAFDQINMELAIDYAKTGRESDAKRQVAYMKLSQPDSDDVEGTFDDAFAGLLKQTEAVVDTSLAETKANPKDGLRQANAILTQTADPLSISRIVLNMGSPVRDAIVTTIFTGVRSCLIIYGNATKDWSGCLELLNELKTITETENQENFVSNDVAMISKNKLIQEGENRCWFCKSPKTCTIDVSMYGNVTRIGRRTMWRNVTVQVPICKECKNKRNHFLNVRNRILWLTFAISCAVVWFGCKFTEDGIASDYGMISLVVGFGLMVLAIILAIIITGHKDKVLMKYPAILRLKNYGFRIGERPLYP